MKKLIERPALLLPEGWQQAQKSACVKRRDLYDSYLPS